MAVGKRTALNSVMRCEWGRTRWNVQRAPERCSKSKDMVNLEEVHSYLSQQAILRSTERVRGVGLCTETSSPHPSAVMQINDLAPRVILQDPHEASSQ